VLQKVYTFQYTTGSNEHKGYHMDDGYRELTLQIYPLEFLSSSSG